MADYSVNCYNGYGAELNCFKFNSAKAYNRYNDSGQLTAVNKNCVNGEDEGMYKLKVIIADDEAAIRNGLKLFLQKECQQLEVTGVYKNGAQVIEHLKCKPVDILITDISMPVKTGIDILQFIQEQALSVKSIMFTGYRDFEYAHKALNYGAASLLTKPLNFYELLKVLSQIEKANKQKPDSDSQLSKYRQNFLRREVQTAVSGFTDPYLAEDAELLKLFSLECAIVEFKALQDTVNSSSNNIPDWRTCGEISDRSLISFCIENSISSAKFVVFLLKGEGENQQTLIKEYIDRVLQNFTSGNKEKIIHKAIVYQSLEDLCIAKFSHIATTYMDYFCVNNTVAKNDLLKSIEANYTDMMCFYFLKAVLQKYRTLYNIDCKEIYEQLNSKRDKKSCLELLENAEAEFARKHADDEDIVVRVKNYIYNHASGDFSLKTIAGVFSVTPAYLSRVFKQKTGKNFNEFTLQVKMKKAEEMLKNSSYSIQKIIEILGYTGEDYFTRVFRIYYGMTPREYRNKKGKLQ